jgi:hypothetical protein
MDTTLYLTAAPANPAAAIAPTHQTFKNIRGQSCYQTLRELISLLQKVTIAFSILVAIAGIVLFLSDGSIVNLIIILTAAAIMVVCGIASKQAALLLVDIADCQIVSLSQNPAQIKS